MLARLLRAVVVALVIAVLGACATARPVLEQPRGFAEYQDASIYRAVSPEGVVIRARLVPNDPPQELAFWAEALKTQLLKSGYKLTGEDSLPSGAGEGVLYEWVAPVGEEDWVYLTGIAVTGKGIAVLEAAGPYEHYASRREALLASLRSLEVR